MTIKALPESGGIRIRFENGAEDFIYDFRNLRGRFAAHYKTPPEARVSNFCGVPRSTVRLVRSVKELREK